MRRTSSARCKSRCSRARPGLLPLFTETRELLRATDWKACDYYGLCAPPLLEHGGNIIPAGSRYADLIVNALEKRGGLPDGGCQVLGRNRPCLFGWLLV